MTPPDTEEQSLPAPDHGWHSEQHVVDPMFDQQFREWVAAETAVFMAIKHAGALDTSCLDELSAVALEKHRLLWAGAHALSARTGESSLHSGT